MKGSKQKKAGSASRSAIPNYSAPQIWHQNRNVFPILQLQRSIGNRATGEWIQTIQRKGLVIQRKAELSKDKLNVAGEDHDKSDQSRNIEEYFSKKETGGGYWTEHQFRLPDGRGTGDPFIDRFTHRQIFLKTDFLPVLNGDLELLKDIIKMDVIDAQIEKMSNQKPDPKEIATKKERKSKLLGGIQQHVKDVAKDVIDINSKLKEFSQAPHLAGLNENEIDQFNQMAPHSAKILTTFAKILHLKDLSGPEDLEQDLLLIQQSLESIIALNPSPNKNDKDREANRKKRSEKMHEAASEQQNVKGVWKIGDSHFDDIHEKHPQVEYNLMNATEFETAYQYWVAEQEKQIEQERQKELKKQKEKNSCSMF